MNNKKIIIVHDTFLYKWGWERLVLMMWNALDADIASWFFSKASFDLRESWFKWQIIPISSEIFKKWFRHIKLKLSFIFNTRFLKEYDTVIFSWDSISAVRNCNKESKKIYYCHTPPRYLYDLSDLYYSKIPFSIKIFYKIAVFLFRKIYERDIKKMNLILVNSLNTQKRLKKFIWVESIVLYPPIDTKKFIYIWQKDYYLSFSRLSDAKRIDIIVKAFIKMPDKKLVVTYWDNDPQKNYIFDLAKWYKNIVFLKLDDKWLVEYLWNCIASICIPIDEDFWMSPVESLSAWKPVIWVNDWWLKETIIDGITWILLDKDLQIDKLIEAVNFLSPKKALEMKEACIKRAKDFSFEKFSSRIKDFIKKS